MVNWAINWEGIRRWIDGEQFDSIPSRIEATAQNKTESERFLQKLKDAIEDILKKEITRIPNINKAYVPEKFVVFLSEEADNSLRHDKRKFFEQGLSAIVLETARDLAGTLDLTSKKIGVSIAVNGILENDVVEVRAISDDAQKTIDLITSEAQSSVETIEVPRKNINHGTIDDVGTIEDCDTVFGILYRVEIWQAGRKINEFPIILRKNTIGRDDNDGNEKVANLRLPTDNRKISRLHAEISLEENGEVWVTALHKNPTILSGSIISNGQKALLGADGEIQIYDFTLKLKFNT